MMSNEGIRGKRGKRGEEEFNGHPCLDQNDGQIQHLTNSLSNTETTSPNHDQTVTLQLSSVSQTPWSNSRDAIDNIARTRQFVGWWAGPVTALQSNCMSKKPYSFKCL